MAGALSRYKVTSSDPSDENEEDIVQTGRVSDRVIHTSKHARLGNLICKIDSVVVHQYGLFKFQTGKNSIPSTPTVSRSRAAIFGLDAISRNLFNAFPGTSRGGDIFGGSINGSRRSKSSVSRSSVSAPSSSDGSFTRFSQRSSSTLTAATSVSSMDDDVVHGSQSSRSKSRTRRLLGRSRSPKGSGSEPDCSPTRPTSRSGSVSSAFSREQSPAAEEYQPGDMASERRDMDESEWDLTMRLELARQNSQNQRSKGSVEPPWDGPVEETIYEGRVITYYPWSYTLTLFTDNPPEPIRPSSRASGSGLSQRSTTPTNRFFPVSLPEINERTARSTSRDASGNRPRGPRSPSPLPPSTRVSPEPDFETINSALETTLLDLNSAPATPPKSVSPLPRSRRQPFEPMGNTETVPKLIFHGTTHKIPSAIEPLSIKKKNSIRHSAGESPSRKTQLRTPPNIRGRIVSPRRVSPIVRQKKAAASPSSPHRDTDLPKLVKLVESIKEEVMPPCWLVLISLTAS
jgi:protein ECT2